MKRNYTRSLPHSTGQHYSGTGWWKPSSGLQPLGTGSFATLRPLWPAEGSFGQSGLCPCVAGVYPSFLLNGPRAGVSTSVTCSRWPLQDLWEGEVRCDSWFRLALLLLFPWWKNSKSLLCLYELSARVTLIASGPVLAYPPPTPRQDSRRQEPLLAGRPPRPRALAPRPGGYVGTSRPQTGGPGDMAPSEPLPFPEAGPGDAAAAGEEQEPQPWVSGEDRPAARGPAHP